MFPCAREGADDFSAVNFGWIGVRCLGENTRRGNTFLKDNAAVSVTRGTMPEDIEYLCAQAAAYDCPLSVNGDLPRFRRHPKADALMDVFRRYEDAKFGGTPR